MQVTLQASDAPATSPTSADPKTQTTTDTATNGGISILWTKTAEMITRKNNHVIVGEHIKLSAINKWPEAWQKDLKYSWEIPGEVIANFEADNEHGKPIPLDGNKLKNQSIDFYWVKGGFEGQDKKVTVTVTSTAHDVPAPGEHPFEIYSPSNAKFMAKMTPYFIGALENHNGDWIYESVGFNKITLDVPNEFSGTIWWIQIIESDRFAQKMQKNPANTVDFVWEQASTPSGLDLRYPANTGDSMVDTIGVAAHHAQTDRIFVAKMKMMWVPTGINSIPIPFASLHYKVWYSSVYDFNKSKYIPNWGNTIERTKDSVADDTFPQWTLNTDNYGPGKDLQHGGWESANGGLNEPAE